MKVMRETGISRRRFLTLATVAAALAGCSPVRVPMPKMGEGPPNVGVKQAFRMGPAPIKGSDAKFTFAQINGAPATQRMAFEKALKKEAQIRKLNIVQENDPAATYVVKGYLSAIGDSRGTLLVYVWDVTDMTGKRLHRVSGQEPGGGSASDPWSGIDDEAVNIAAGRMVDDLVAWIS
jgi:hypothetical protein